ncbi:MAG: right-handed parallel beta-helix repeat-containing protein [Candidatus Bathyarchaeota archaeon]|nr:right-handed parallel beta-helix repeat-containing protein [Candidatus Bathyarchaeota archaeon]
MKKTALTLVLILALSMASIAGTQLVHFSSANFFPEQPPSGIQITSSGAVEGTDLIQRSGNVYTLTGDIHRTIVILRDGIVLDGAGYTLQGSGIGAGVFLQERNGVTIKNLRIKNFQYGIKFTWLNYGAPATPRSNKVIGNTITNNTYGVVFYDFSSGNEVSDNYISDNTYGVAAGSHTVFRNNQFRNNGGAITESSYSVNDIDASNTVNGKPVYYWVDQHDRTVPSDAGWVVLRNCSGITVHGLSLQGNGDGGVSLYYTNESTITSNVITKNINGIKLTGSFNNVISDNHVASNTEYGIYLDGASKANTISSNRIESNGKDGVSVYALDSLTGNMVSQNQVSGNLGNGISVNGAQNWKIIGNNITLNRGAGISFLYGSSNNTVNGNYIAGNGLGILLSDAVENKITFNAITENNGWGIELNGSQANNLIHHNNFINNNVTGLQVRVAGVFDFPDFNKPQTSEPEPPKFVAGAANVWDDGKKGNYWSDYKTRYPNASGIGNTGVGSTPYFINENNIDRYPLMSPLQISIELPPDSPTSPSQEPTPSTKSQTEQAPFPAALFIIFAASTVIIGLGLILHFIKRRHSTQLQPQPPFK